MLSLIGWNGPRSFLIFQIVRFLSNIVVSIILAKSYLSVSEIGRYESFLFFASAFSFFLVTGISQGLLSTFNRKAIHNQVFYLAFLFLIGMVLIISSFLFFGNLFSSTSILNGLNKSELSLLSFYIVIYPPGLLIEYILFLNNKYKDLVIYSLVSSLLLILMIYIPLYFKFEVDYCLIGLVIIAVAKFLLLLILLKKLNALKFNKYAMLQLIRMSIPLAATALVAGASAYIDGYIVSHYYDSTTFAIFRYGAREFPIFLMISTSFDARIIPEFSKNEDFTELFSLIKQKSSQYIRNFIPLTILFLSISQFVFQYVFNKGFYESYIVFDIYLLLVISRFIFRNTILIGMYKSRILLIIGAIELVVNVAASLIFMHYFGYIGVAYGTVIAYISEKIMHIIYLKYRLNVQLSSYVPIMDLMAYSALLISAFMIKNLI